MQGGRANQDTPTCVSYRHKQQSSSILDHLVNLGFINHKGARHSSLTLEFVVLPRADLHNISGGSRLGPLFVVQQCIYWNVFAHV